MKPLPAAQGQSLPGLSPPLKWAGGKRWLLPELDALWKQNPSKRLVEPFCGGLAVVLGLNPDKALLNDANPHLINFYKNLQKGLLGDKKFLNDKEVYYANRELFNALIREQKANSPTAAKLFYYLNRTGYNGLCRFNNQGFFNVPFGRYKTISYAQDFLSYRNSLKKWTFSNTDFQSLKIRETDFLYADPPYDVPFVSYSRQGFSWGDQVRLADWLVDLSCPVVVSNQATERILELYRDRGFNIRLLDAPRRISCNGDRRKATEMLAVKGLS